MVIKIPINVNEIDEANKYANLTDYKIMKHLKANPNKAFFAEDLANALDEIKATIWIRIRYLEDEGLLIRTKIANRIAVYYKPSTKRLILKKEGGRETLSVT